MDHLYPPVQLQGRREIFIDEEMLSDVWNCPRKVHQPFRHARNPVLVKDRPWEGIGPGGVDVDFDDKDGTFRMWYSVTDIATRAHPAQGIGLGSGYYTCYAVSRDGYEWEKPLLDVVSTQDFPQSNIVYAGRRLGRISVFRDPQDSDPERRFKAVTLDLHNGIDKCNSLSLAHSPDGIHWTLHPHGAMIVGHSDTKNHIVFDPIRKRYLMIMRPSISAGQHEPWPGTFRHTRRRVAVSISEDLVHWTYPECCMFPEEGDFPDIDNMSVWFYGNGFIMLYTVLDGDAQGQTFEIEVASSRDGLRWHRLPTREKFIQVGAPHAFDSHMILAPTPPITYGGEWLMYYVGYNGPHESLNHREGSVGVLRLRSEGIVSRSAGEQPGCILTRRVEIDGDQLLINAICRRPDSYIGVELLEHKEPGAAHASWNGRVVEGYSLEECDPIRTNFTDHPVTWRGGKNLLEVRGRHVYLRFRLRNAELFAYQIR